jgi:hypothetical protein
MGYRERVEQNYRRTVAEKLIRNLGVVAFNSRHYEDLRTGMLELHDHPAAIVSAAKDPGGEIHGSCATLRMTT